MVLAQADRVHSVGLGRFAELGPDGYVSRDDTIEHIIHAVDAVRRSERYIGPTISDMRAREGAGSCRA
jgi:hypothetical protein